VEAILAGATKFGEIVGITIGLLEDPIVGLDGRPSLRI
jgi:hypothetical protein